RFGFSRRSEDRFGQLRRQIESGWQFNAANALRLLIFFPTGTGEITAHNAFHRQWLGFPYDHGTPSKPLAERLQLFGELVERCRDKVIPDVVESPEPKRGNLVEHRAFVGNRIG